VDVNILSWPLTVPWAAIITAISTLVAGLGGVWITNHYNDQRDARRLDQEWKMKLRDDRKSAYATMARITKSMDVDDPLKIDDLAEAHSEIEMLTEDSQVLDAAEQVLYAAHAGRQALAKKNIAMDDESATHPTHKKLAVRRFEDAKEELDKYRTLFVNSARKELGLGPRPSMASPEPREEPETASPAMEGVETPIAQEKPVSRWRSWVHRLFGGPGEL
jgi:hypothetical protein